MARNAVLAGFLESNGIAQTELAKGIGRSDALVSRVARGEAGASQDTIDAVLSWLTSRLGRTVTYEETFGAPQGAETAA